MLATQRLVVPALYPSRAAMEPVTPVCATIEDLITEMTHRWQRLHQAGDWRAVFAQTYLGATQKILIALQAGRFENTEWMIRLACTFAQYYFDAIDSWEATGRSPLAWQASFEYAGRRRTLVLQDVLLGMNAHINNDLPYVLHQLIPPEATPTELASYYRDHKQVDVVFAEAIDAIQATADDHDPSLTLADAAFGRHDEKSFAKLVSLWRTHAWSYFLLLRSHPHRAEAERLISGAAYHYALLLLQFQHVAPHIYWPHRIYRQVVSWVTRRVRR